MKSWMIALVMGLSSIVFSQVLLAAPAPLHDYEFNGSLADSQGGAAITSEGGTVGATTYQFIPTLPPPENPQDESYYLKGLTLASPGLTDPGVYSIEMRVRLNSIDNITIYKGLAQPFVKLIDFQNRTQDYGFYTEDITDFDAQGHGQSSIIETYGPNEFNFGDSPNFLVHPNQWFDLVLTRDSAGTASVYFNGNQAFTFDNSADSDLIFSGPNNVMRFLQDDLVSPNYGPPGGPVYETTQGEMDFLKIWNSALSADDVASLNPIVAGDFNHDGHFTVADIQAAMAALSDLNNYVLDSHLVPGELEKLGDFNQDGVFDNTDLQAMINALANGGGQGDLSVVPEPTSAVLLVLGGLSLLPLTRRQCRITQSQ